MRDLTNKRVILIKGWLFLLIGLLSSLVLVLRHPEFTTMVLLVTAIWAFCRFYYFAFYVIEHYIDGELRYTGLGDFVRYWVLQKKKPPKDSA